MVGLYHILSNCLPVYQNLQRPSEPFGWLIPLLHILWVFLATEPVIDHNFRNKYIMTVEE